MGNTVRQAYSYSTSIQQKIASGHNFDGTFPTGDSPLAGSFRYEFASQNAGGLFFWDMYAEPVICGQFHCDLGGPADFSLYLVNLDVASVKAGTPTVVSGSEILIEEQTGVKFVALDEARFKVVVLPYQALKLVTTVSGAAQIAQAVASIERTYVR